MNHNALYLGCVVRWSGGIDSRKRLMKMMYILQKLGYPTTFSFTNDSFGPYSHELSSEVAGMVRSNHLREIKVDDRYAYDCVDTSFAYIDNSKMEVLSAVEGYRVMIYELSGIDIEMLEACAMIVGMKDLDYEAMCFLLLNKRYVDLDEERMMALMQKVENFRKKCLTC